MSIKELTEVEMESMGSCGYLGRCSRLQIAN